MSLTVSVIIPAYNQEKFIEQSIDSVLAQTFSDYEIIVVNDGSTDGTAQLLERYGTRIRIISQTNAGLSQARNAGIEVSKGEMLAFLDADDLWYPWMLSRMVSCLEKNSETDFVAGSCDLIDETGRFIRKAYPYSFELKSRIQTDCFRELALGNPFAIHTLLLRKTCFKYHRFDPTLKALEDWDLWLRLTGDQHKVHLVNIPVALYRRHIRSMTFDIERMEAAFNQVLEKLFSEASWANYLGDIKDQVYLSSYLQLVQYACQAGSTSDMSRFIEKIEATFHNASVNQDINWRCIYTLAQFPVAKTFVDTVVSMTPDGKAVYAHAKARQFFYEKKYFKAIIFLLNSMLNYPCWVLTKVPIRLAEVFVYKCSIYKYFIVNSASKTKVNLFF